MTHLPSSKIDGQINWHNSQNAYDLSNLTQKHIEAGYSFIQYCKKLPLTLSVSISY